jgi:hypothetical protein
MTSCAREKKSFATGKKCIEKIRIGRALTCKESAGKSIGFVRLCSAPDRRAVAGKDYAMAMLGLARPWKCTKAPCFAKEMNGCAWQWE